MLAFRRAGQVVPDIYRQQMEIMNLLSLELRMLKLGYPYEVIRTMPLKDVLLRVEVLGFMHV